MANIKDAVDFTLRQEDSTMSGAITGSANDRGGRTRFGIAEVWHPDLTKTGFYSTMDTADALDVAENILANQYATPLMLASISDQGVATALLSMAVVEGNVEAVKCLQGAVGAVQDGQMGPNTLAAVNVATNVMQKFAALEDVYFRSIVAKDPTQAKWIKGWLNRVTAVQALA